MTDRQTIDAIIAHLRTARPELVHFAGAMHRDPAARRVIEEYLLAPIASEDDLRAHARDRRSPIGGHPGDLCGLWRSVLPTLGEAGAVFVARVLGYDIDADRFGGGTYDVTLPPLMDLDSVLEWVASTAGVGRDHLVVHGREISVLGAPGCLALYEVARNTEQPGARQDI